MTQNCLNCEKELSDKFCSGCGQKADTHRITFRNFIFHDLMHGTFHIDRGILFTSKEAILRPGKASLDYIYGKRKRYYNVFYLILLVIGVMLFFRHIDQIIYGSTETEPAKIYLNDASKKFDEIITQKNKIILLLFIPFSAINSFVLFRRRKLNISEHFIISGMILLGLLLLSTAANLYFPINNFLKLSGTIASIVVTIILIAYVIFAYINAFGNDGYTKFGLLIRILLFFAMLFLEVYLLFLLLFGFVSDWKFGQINISPFS